MRFSFSGAAASLLICVTALQGSAVSPRAVEVRPVNRDASGPALPSAPPTEPAHPDSIALWLDGAPGSESRRAEPEDISWRQEVDIVFPVVSNIHRPSITPFLPSPESATGCAVIVAPGGGHMQLTINREGYDLGRWLADRGIAAFVLKYRLARDGSTPVGRPQPYTIEGDALADTQRAIRLIRSRAPEWRVNPERLFGNGHAAATVEAGLRRKLYHKSVLDYVLDDARRIETRLSVGDRGKLDEYLTAVRDLERRVERAEQFPALAVPAGVQAPEMFETYEQHMELMYEVMALAFQTDSTRIATFCVAHDGSNRPYPTIGIREGHHDLSHHREDAEKKKKLAQINRYHVTQFSKFLDRLKSIPEGEGNVLDNSTILYGSALSNGDKHSPVNLPILLAGHGGGALAAAQHVRVDEHTPMTNLYRSMLDSIGVRTEKVGDSTGKVEQIFQPVA